MGLAIAGITLYVAMKTKCTEARRVQHGGVSLIMIALAFTGRVKVMLGTRIPSIGLLAILRDMVHSTADRKYFRICG